MFRNWFYALAAAAALVGASAPSQAAMLVDGIAPAAPSLIENTAYIDVAPDRVLFNGRWYCWYDSGWRGPGYYWCGYAMRVGFGWGGGDGWRGHWRRGGGHWRGHGGRPPMIGRPHGGGPRPHPGRPHPGRPHHGGHGGGRPHGGGGHHGGGRPHGGGGHRGGGGGRRHG